MNFENYMHVFSRLLDIWKEINPGNVDASIIVNQQKVHDRMACCREDDRLINPHRQDTKKLHFSSRELLHLHNRVCQKEEQKSGL